MMICPSGRPRGAFHTVFELRLEDFEVYRDPVHDFGLFQFDATELRFTPPTAIAVAPSELFLGGPSMLLWRLK